MGWNPNCAEVHREQYVRMQLLVKKICMLLKKFVLVITLTPSVLFTRCIGWTKLASYLVSELELSVTLA